MASKTVPSIDREEEYPLLIQTEVELIEWNKMEKGLGFDAKLKPKCDWEEHFKDRLADSNDITFDDLSPMLKPYDPSRLAQEDKDNFIFKSWLRGYRLKTNGRDDLKCNRSLSNTKHQLQFTLLRKMVWGESAINDFNVDVFISETDIQHPQLSIEIQTSQERLKRCADQWNASQDSSFKMQDTHLNQKIIPFADIGIELGPYVDCENQISNDKTTFIDTHNPDKWSMTLTWGDKKEDITQIGSALIQTQICQTNRLQAKNQQIKNRLRSGEYRPENQVVEQAQIETISHMFSQCGIEHITPILCDNNWFGGQIIERIQKTIRYQESQLNPRLIAIYAQLLNSDLRCISDTQLMRHVDFLVHFTIRRESDPNQKAYRELSKNLVSSFTDRLPKSWINRNIALLNGHLLE